MSNGKVMIVHLKNGLTKMTLYKKFPKPYEPFEEILMLKLICPIMQQKQISKIFHTLILQVLY